MSDEHELLDLAAKAAGYKIRLAKWSGWNRTGRLSWAFKWSAEPMMFLDGVEWNPFVDDGDALRLALSLRLRFETREDAQGVFVWLINDNVDVREWGYVRETGSYEASARRAIVRAAAEIGRIMP